MVVLGTSVGPFTGRCGHAPGPKPRQKSKILTPPRHLISVNALAGGSKQLGLKKKPANLLKFYLHVLSARLHAIYA